MTSDIRFHTLGRPGLQLLACTRDHWSGYLPLRDRSKSSISPKKRKFEIIFSRPTPHKRKQSSFLGDVESLSSGEGCFQPGARFWKGGCIWLCPKFVPDFVRACTENLPNRFWWNFVHCLLVWSSCALLSMEGIGTPLHGFLGGIKNRALLRASAWLCCVFTYNWHMNILCTMHLIHC